jgi:signal transduction histidine kinase
MTYTDVPEVLIFAIMLSWVYFNIYWFVSYSKLNILFEIVIKNEKLIKENKKIIEAFPHAVLIESQNNWFTNLEFDKKFKVFDNWIDDLQQMLVKIDEEYGDREGQFGHGWVRDTEIKTLSQCLQRQVERLKNDDVTEQHSVYIKNMNSREHENRDLNEEQVSSEESESEKSNQNFNKQSRFDRGRYCSIKSMKVLWNCQPSIMHVFIDTTNILKLEEANNNIKCQKIMFTSASHEFRTPLNSILNAWDIVRQAYSQVLRMISTLPLDPSKKRNIEKQSEIIQKFIKIGKHSSELLLALVEDILNLSKMESNMFSLNIAEFNPEELIREVADMFEFQWKGKKLRMEIRVEPQIKMCLMSSDRGRIKQALINLVANAYKFTYFGSITISLRAVILDKQKAVEFSVKDTGIGISEEDQTKLFKLFGMLEDPNKINSNGCGIGLTVSKKYVEMLKGEFKVESKLGEGTEMTIVIPKLIAETEKRDGEWKDCEIK